VLLKGVEDLLEDLLQESVASLEEARAGGATCSLEELKAELGL